MVACILVNQVQRTRNPTPAPTPSAQASHSATGGTTAAAAQLSPSQLRSLLLDPCCQGVFAEVPASALALHNQLQHQQASPDSLAAQPPGPADETHAQDTQQPSSHASSSSLASETATGGVTLDLTALRRVAELGLTRAISSAWPHDTPLDRIRRCAAFTLAGASRGPTGQSYMPYTMLGSALGTAIRKKDKDAFDALAGLGKLSELLSDSPGGGGGVLRGASGSGDGGGGSGGGYIVCFKRDQVGRCVLLPKGTCLEQCGLEFSRCLTMPVHLSMCTSCNVVL